MVSMTVLALLAPLLVLLAVTAAPYVLLAADLGFVMLGNAPWSLGGVSVDVTDLIIAAIGLALAVRRGWLRDAVRRGSAHLGLWIAFLALITVGYLQAKSLLRTPGDSLLVLYQLYLAGIAVGLLIRSGWRQEGRGGIPYFWLWIVYGTMVSVVYLHAPLNQPNFSSPIAVAYQLYRYAWKPILYFALVAVLIGDGQKLQRLLLLLVVLADACSLWATWQGYTGIEPTGPFLTKNQLGGNLIIPFAVCLSGVLYPRSRRSLTFHWLSLLLLLRAFTIAGSRGAFVAIVAAAGVLFACFVLTRRGRARAPRLLLAGAGLAILALAVRPDLLHRPSVQNLLAITHATTVDTIEWRVQERWPHFWNTIEEHPWLGVGTEVDLTLGSSGNTPHNGYLALGVIGGVPATLVFLAFLSMALASALSAFFRARHPSHRALGAAIAAGLVGVAVHNLVDATFLLPFAAKQIWLVTAVSLVLARNERAFPLPDAVHAAPPLARRPLAVSPLTPLGARP